MSKRCQLLVAAQIHGEVRPAGYVFVLEDGETGPMRTIGMNGTTPRDEKLYVELPDEEPAQAACEPQANAAAAEGNDEGAPAAAGASDVD